MHREKKKYDFLAIGQAIKAVREDKGWIREQVAEMVDLAPRYIMSIENKGQHPSFQVFYELVTLFNISVDQYLFPNKPIKKSTRRRQLDNLLDLCNEKDLIILESTAKGIVEARTAEEA
ncbi:MAG: helix-turn-helix domain-containing protein [Candidatus Izemoplasmatales bacterium]